MSPEARAEDRPHELALETGDRRHPGAPAGLEAAPLEVLGLTFHVPADESVAPGLSLCPARSGGGFNVLSPYQGTDATQKVKSGERLIAVEGKSGVWLDLEALRALWRQAGEGAHVTQRCAALRFAGPPETEQSVRVERLLADLL